MNGHSLEHCLQMPSTVTDPWRQSYRRTIRVQSEAQAKVAVALSTERPAQRFIHEFDFLLKSQNLLWVVFRTTQHRFMVLHEREWSPSITISGIAYA